MAGYDFDVRVGDKIEDSFIRQVLKATQLGCRQRGVELKYRRTDDGYYVTVDGPLPYIQSVMQPLGAMMAGMVDAIPTPLTRRRRGQVARRVLRGYVRGAWAITASVFDLSGVLDGTPNSFIFDEVADPVIQYRLDALSSMLQAWNNEDTTPEQMVEELHATTETLMGWLLGEHWDDRSYAEQAAEVTARGLLTEAERDVLVALKNRRRQVRHHRGAMDRQELMDYVPQVLPVIHKLATARAAYD